MYNSIVSSECWKIIQKLYKMRPLQGAFLYTIHSLYLSPIIRHFFMLYYSISGIFVKPTNILHIFNRV